jgi:hypothetical protein
MPAPIDLKVRRSLDSDPALVRVNLSSSAGLWRIVRPLGRAYLLDEGGSRTPVQYTETAGGGMTAAVPPGPVKRTLVLAEPADGWSAASGGSSLAGRTVDGWAQGFEVPTAGGRVTMERPAFWHDVWLWTQLVMVVLVLVLASPGARTAEAFEEYAEAPVARQTEGALVR